MAAIFDIACHVGAGDPDDQRAHVSVLGMWERWLEPERFERRVWKNAIDAFEVDHWAMCDVNGGPFSSPVQHADLTTMLAAHPGPKTFLIPPHSIEGAVNLAEYVHPVNAIYVFGRGGENLVKHVTPADEVVSIHMPLDGNELYAAVAAGMVLYDRRVKS